MPVTVRQATVDDAATLAALLNAFDGTTTTSAQLTSRMQASAPFLTMYLGILDGQVAGFACLRLLPHLQGDDPYAEITDLYVAPPFRRRGVARALLANVHEVAQAAGARYVVLTTDFTNVSAQAVYRTAGYANHALVMRKAFPIRRNLAHRYRSREMTEADMQRFYNQGRERDRLARGAGVLELARTQELLQRHLPSPPAEILDVGGGPGVYAAWLSRAGYRVHLIDPVPLHVAQAQETAAAQPAYPFTAALGDARHLDAPDASCDAVLYLGPLYHLPAREERLAALAEARRVLRPGSVACIGAISRFGSLLDAVRQGYLDDPEAMAVIETTVRDGRNWDPGLDRFPGWFPAAHFHLPDELAGEITESGLSLDCLVGVEGPGGFIGERTDSPLRQANLLRVARLVESEPSLLGLSPHLLAVARKVS